MMLASFEIRLYQISFPDLERMQRTSSKMSFWMLRPTQNRDIINIQLPLLSRSQKINIKEQHSHQISCIIDHTNVQNIKKEQRFIDCLLRWYGQAMDRHDIVIHPESTLLLVWNLLIFLITFVNFIEIPIALLLVEDSYYQIYENKGIAVIYYLILDIFIYDMIVVRPRISYQINGKNITKSQEILRYYLRNYFWIDFLCILVIILSFLPIRYIDYLRFLFLLKIIPLQEINRQIKFKLLIKRYSSALYGFIKLVFFIVFVTNMYACIYFSIDYYFYKQQGFFYQNGYLWINGTIGTGYLDILQAFGHSGAYIYALFWALETARTCGYGIATPRNYISMLYVNFVMLTIVVIFVYFTNGIINLIITHGQSRRKKLNTIKKIVDVCQQLSIQSPIKNRIVEYITDFQNPDEELEEYMDRLLSPMLKNQFKLSFRRHFINLIEIVSLISDEGIQSELFKIDLAGIIRHQHYQIDDVIHMSKKHEEPVLFLIQRGVCTVQNLDAGYRKFQNEWTLIGKIEFYFDKMPIYTVIANEYLEGLQMKRADFLSCLKRYKKMHEKYLQIMDEIMICRHDTRSLHIRCPFCANFHLHQHCPIVNQWRMDLRIKKDLKDQIYENERKKKYRLHLRTRKINNFSIKFPEVQKVYRTSEYFKHYNI